MIVIPVSGPPRERGEAVGRAHRDAISRLLARRTTPAAAVQPYAECVRQQLPILAAEVAGLAAGSGIAEDDAWWLQLRRELLAVPAGDCTTAAFASAGLIGQTVDLPPGLGDGLHALDIAPDGESPAALVVTFAGLLGYLGINAAGLAVGINMVQSADWGIGVPPYLLVRAVLGCRGLDEAVDLLRTAPRASSRVLTLLAGDAAAVVEMTATDLRVTEAATAAMTNHFVHPDLAPLDTSEPAARMESRVRRRRLQVRLGETSPDVAGLQRTLLDPAFQVNGPVLATVATVVSEPGRGRVHVRPRNGDWQTITGSWAA
ncbi:MAG TPA: C45 family peptidase [Jatrophihabitans sp.]|jgi:hypothetical protein|uniref:C45 family autoproteolytic acyltransferase/hydolase n=1 Tax=Jatrophihabitans sp. TaxID=1932789 RepID=UPI002EEDE0A1